jgi:ferrous iron transport protein B
VKIAFAGNPNAGKSALVNALAGTRLHVGNWPGVTVEKKEAVLRVNGGEVRLVDLPGTYSLSTYSIEERVTRDFLLHERPDVLVAVVDSTNLERNLYLTLQLLELGIPMVIALNVWDEAREKGIAIDVQRLGDLLEVEVVPTVAITGEGVDGLIPAAQRVHERQPRTVAEYNSACRLATERGTHLVHYGPLIDPEVRLLGEALHREVPEIIGRVPCRWLAVKCLEGDDGARELLDGQAPAALWTQIDEQRRRIRTLGGNDVAALVTDGRYGFIKGLVQDVVTQSGLGRRDLTERVDRLVLNRLLGIPIFLGMIWLVFHITFDGSAPFIDWVDGVVNGPLERWAKVGLAALGAPVWMNSLLSEGVVGGVGFVLTFVPVLCFLYLFLGLLEGSGYMARAAFIMDRFLHGIGLHGKSFIPMILGFGCNVPAVYATRALDTYRDRVLTSLLIPLMSCSARLPVYALFVAAFFQKSRGTIIFGLYMLGIVLAVGAGFIFKRTLFVGEAPSFVMELPPYRLPTIRSLLLYMWDKVRAFVKKAGTYILATSVLVWFLLNLPWGVQQRHDSYFGIVAQTAAPVFAPMGFGSWEAAGALMTGIIAKEVVVSTMGEIYATDADAGDEQPPTVSEELRGMGAGFLTACKDSLVSVLAGLHLISATLEDAPPSALTRRIQQAFTPLTAMAFMVFVLTYIPCVVTMAALGQELGWRWTGFAIVYLLTLGWLLSFMTYQGGRLLGFA